jgi:hypothetical protein
MTRIESNRTLRNGALTMAFSALALIVGRASANELQVVGSARSFVIHNAQETLTRFCATDPEGRLWMTLPGGRSFELVTSTADPAIANPGDGSFHAFDESEVRAALAAVRYPVGSLRVDVFLLPYPRRNGLESAAAPQLILLSPGVRPLTREQQHAEFTHELGHVVQYALMPDPDADRWNAYRRLRGIEDEQRFSSDAHHADRPHEIFAEDFRALFGGTLANYSGTIENADITAPEHVSGLRSFLLDLVGVQSLSALRTDANPARGALSFYRSGRDYSALDLFDVTGRRLATVEPASTPSGTQWNWNGLDAHGARIGPGVVFARIRNDASRTTLRVTLLP